ncbi:MAG: phospholipase A [Desulforhopalus sp.]
MVGRAFCVFPERGVRETLVMILGCFVFCSGVQANTEEVAMEKCVAKLFKSAPDTMTAGEIRAECKKELDPSNTSVASDEKEPGVIDQRIRIDKENTLSPFTIMAHRQNYLLAVAHNFYGYSGKEFVEFTGDSKTTPDDTEAQFQISIKTPLAIDLFDTDVDIFAAYTVRSCWQLYNDDNSSPFRETNHEPELWVETHPEFEIFGLQSVATAFGIVHQSNGQSSNLSRSWNRIYADLILQRGNFAISIKPWFRIEEDDDDDDNPDITDYLGHGELRLAYKWNEHVFTLMSRNNLESGFSNGAVELGWSFPLFNFPYLKGYVQYFSGYGESLIDYDQYVNRLGAGILLTDLL